MPEDVPIELVVDRLADWSHQRQREQLAIGKWRFTRSDRQDDPAQRESSEVELPQCQGVGDRSPAFQRRRALRIAHRQNAGEQNEDGNEKSQRASPCPDERHASETPIRGVLRAASSSRENSRKADRLSRGNPDKASPSLHVPVKRSAARVWSSFADPSLVFIGWS